MTGKVIRNTGSHYVVRSFDDNRTYPCKVKGNFRIKGIRTTNPVAVGDIVDFSPAPMDATGETSAFITRIHPRNNYIIRRASNLSKESHIIAANIDLALLIVTLAHPTTATTFIDRFLATAQAYDVPTAIIVNKIDLLTDPDDKEYLDAFTYLYESIGYPVVHVSARNGEGFDQLRDIIRGKTALLSGNSGVGKSSIINRLVPDANLRTAEISSSHDSGQHTTTFSELLPVPDSDGGALIDTPGIRGFGTIDFNRNTVAHYFPEIFKISANCRFSNCTHTHEPGCAVLEAVNDNLISASRYNSYLSILDEIATDNADAKYRKSQ